LLDSLPAVTASKANTRESLAQFGCDGEQQERWQRDGRHGTFAAANNLIDAMTAHLSANYRKIPREGSQSRFLPSKTPDDLITSKTDIAAIYDS